MWLEYLLSRVDLFICLIYFRLVFITMLLTSFLFTDRKISPNELRIVLLIEQRINEKLRFPDYS